MGELETGEKLDKVYRAICEGGIIGEAEGCEFLGSNPICMDVRPHFGDTSGDASYNINNACIEGYFRFNNTYTCENPSSLVFDCDDYPDKSPCKYLDTSGNYSCRYRIGVQVKDSWGWCNADHWSTKLIGQGSAGDMEPTVIGTEGYWADGAEDNCKYNSNAYEYYDGYIYVSP